MIHTKVTGSMNDPRIPATMTHTANSPSSAPARIAVLIRDAFTGRVCDRLGNPWGATERTQVQHPPESRSWLAPKEKSGVYRSQIQTVRNDLVDVAVVTSRRRLVHPAGPQLALLDPWCGRGAGMMPTCQRLARRGS
jgi:hypothetical protein